MKKASPLLGGRKEGVPSSSDGFEILMSDKDRKLFEMREKYKNVDYDNLQGKLEREEKEREFDAFYNHLMQEEKKGQDVSQEGSEEGESMDQLMLRAAQNNAEFEQEREDSLDEEDKCQDTKAPDSAGIVSALDFRSRVCSTSLICTERATTTSSTECWANM